MKKIYSSLLLWVLLTTSITTKPVTGDCIGFAIGTGSAISVALVTEIARRLFTKRLIRGYEYKVSHSLFLTRNVDDIAKPQSYRCYWRGCALLTITILSMAGASFLAGQTGKHCLA